MVWMETGLLILYATRSQTESRFGRIWRDGEPIQRDKCVWQTTRRNWAETMVSLCSVHISGRGTRLAWQLFACQGPGDFRRVRPPLSRPCDPAAKNASQLWMHYCITHDMAWGRGSQSSGLWNRSSLQTGFVWLSSTDWQCVFRFFFFFSICLQAGRFDWNAQISTF